MIVKDQVQIIRILKRKPQFHNARVRETGQDGFLGQDLPHLVLPVDMAFFHHFDGEVFSFSVMIWQLLL